MHKRPLPSAMDWLSVFGVSMMLALTACETAVVQPAPTQTKPVVQPVADDDPPEKPIKPPGSS